MTRALGIAARLEVLLDPVLCFQEATGYDPEPWQPAYLRETRNAIVLKGRQVGASTCTGLLGVRKAALKARSTTLIVSPSLNQSKEVKERASAAIERLGLRTIADSASEVELENHSRIISLPGSKKSVRGWTATGLLVVDEAAFLDPDTYLAARAIAATGARTCVQSTPASPYGHFHDLWQHPDAGWAKFRVTSEEVSTIGAEFLATERATLTADDYAQEYLATFAPPGMGLVDPARLEELTIRPPEAPAAAPSVWDRARPKDRETQAAFDAAKRVP